MLYILSWFDLARRLRGETKGELAYTINLICPAFKSLYFLFFLLYSHIHFPSLFLPLSIFFFAFPSTSLLHASSFYIFSSYLFLPSSTFFQAAVPYLLPKFFIFHFSFFWSLLLQLSAFSFPFLSKFLFYIIIFSTIKYPSFNGVFITLSSLIFSLLLFSLFSYLNIYFSPPFNLPLHLSL